MAMNFAAAQKRVRGLLAPKKPGDLSRSSLTEDKLRDNIVREEGDRSERFQASLRKRPEVQYEREHEDGSKTEESFEWETYPEAVRDFARAAFGYDEPEIRSRDQMRPDYRFNREVMQAAINSPGMRELRPYSRNNALESLYGSMAYGDKLEELAQECAAEHVAREEEIREQMEQISDADTLMENLRKLAGQENQQHGTVQDPTRRQIKQALKQGQAAHDALANLMQQQAASSMTVDAIRMGEQAAEAAADAAEAIASLPGTEEGQSRNMDPDAQIALAEKWNRNEMLRKIARQLGRRVRSLAFKRETRTKHVPMYPVGIESGGDVERMLPQEAARLLSPNPLVRAAFIRDIEERSVLQYEKHGRLPAGKGPIISAHDGSGSMDTDMGGLSKLGWSKSLGLALLTIAQREKRHYCAIEFGSRGELRVWVFPKDQPPDPNVVIDYASHFFGGGTDTAVALREAARIAGEQPEFKTADLILIGDGQDTYAAEDQQLVRELEDLSVRRHGISIGCPGNVYMQQACDHVIDIADLTSEDAVFDALAENMT